MSKRHTEIVPPNPNHNFNRCHHDYLITRVVMKHPEGGFVVLGSDNKFHVVHSECVGEWTPEIALSTRGRA